MKCEIWFAISSVSASEICAGVGFRVPQSRVSLFPYVLASHELEQEAKTHFLRITDAKEYIWGDARCSSNRIDFSAVEKLFSRWRSQIGSQDAGSTVQRPTSTTNTMIVPGR